MQTQYIDSTPGLEALCQSLVNADWLAIDTEFVREKTYYAKLCLVQICDGEKISLVDTLAIDDLAPLCELLENPSITKVLHSASQDLEVLYQLRGKVPRPVFDTQIAAALLGQPGQVSYAAMVEKYCGVMLDKSHSRTDWSQRPLSQSQLEYAAADVDYLGRIYHLLHDQLEKRGRSDWHRELCEKLYSPENYENPPELAWQRIKGTGRMKPVSLAILHALAAWREEQAQARDIPRRWVMADDRLLNMAWKRPDSMSKLAECGLNEKQAGRYAKQLLEIISSAQNTPEDSWPSPPEQYIPGSAEKKMTKKLMHLVQEIGHEQDIDPAYLARRKDIEKLVRGDRQLELLQGWRYEIAGKTLLRQLEASPG